MTDEQKALQWWDTLRSTRLTNGMKDKGYYTDLFFGYNQRMWKYLKKEEIVQIWERFAKEPRKKYVVLEHLTLPQRGRRFWSTNSDNNTHSIGGALWYKEVLFTDDEDEAIRESGKVNHGVTPSDSELEEYYKSKPFEF